MHVRGPYRSGLLRRALHRGYDRGAEMTVIYVFLGIIATFILAGLFIVVWGWVLDRLVGR